MDLRFSLIDRVVNCLESGKELLANNGVLECLLDQTELRG